jgi:hypothetical protein
MDPQPLKTITLTLQRKQCVTTFQVNCIYCAASSIHSFSNMARKMRKKNLNKLCY